MNGIPEVRARFVQGARLGRGGYADIPRRTTVPPASTSREPGRTVRRIDATEAAG